MAKFNVESTDPKIDLNLLSHPDDLKTLRNAFRVVQEILHSDRMKAMMKRPLYPDRYLETDEEIEKTMDDLIENKVDILTLGQYLRPTLNHLPIERWVTPEEFEAYREIGLKKGFLEVVSGPMVRSSYRAERALEKNNAGL